MIICRQVFCHPTSSLSLWSVRLCGLYPWEFRDSSLWSGINSLRKILYQLITSQSILFLHNNDKLGDTAHELYKIYSFYHELTTHSGYYSRSRRSNFWHGDNDFCQVSHNALYVRFWNEVKLC